MAGILGLGRGSLYAAGLALGVLLAGCSPHKERVAPTLSGPSLDVLLHPAPQAFTNSCQSYALGFALSRAGVPGFGMDTVGDVTTIETGVRSAIDQSVGPGEDAYSHSVWKKAVTKLTSGDYVLNEKQYSTADELMDDIVAKTSIDNAASLGSVLSATLSKTPVMTSFKQIGPDTYATGHIVTIFGLDRPPTPTTTVPRLMLLNSAVKTPPPSSAYQFACNASQLPTSFKYTGALSLESSYELNRYGGKYVLFWITPR